MPWLGDRVLAWSARVQIRDLERFNGMLAAMDGSEIGAALAVAADLRNRFLLIEQVDLHYPSVCLIENPKLAVYLNKMVREFKAANSGAYAGAAMIWLHTIRSMTDLRIRPSGRRMWAELARGIPHTEAAADMHRYLFGTHLNISEFDVIPDGLGERT